LANYAGKHTLEQQEKQAALGKPSAQVSSGKRPAEATNEERVGNFTLLKIDNMEIENFLSQGVAYFCAPRHSA